MIQTLARNRWLLVLCGLLYAAISALYLTMTSSDGSRTFANSHAAVVLAGELAIAAGVCAVAAALWRSATGKSWALAASGAALIVLGVIQYGLTHLPISITVVAALALVMTASAGFVDLVIARKLRGAERWILRAIAWASVACSLPLFAIGFHWIATRPGSRDDLLWLGSLFGISAAGLCLVALRVDARPQPRPV